MNICNAAHLRTFSVDENVRRYIKAGMIEDDMNCTRDHEA